MERARVSELHSLLDLSRESGVARHSEESGDYWFKMLYGGSMEWAHIAVSSALLPSEAANFDSPENRRHFDYVSVGFLNDDGCVFDNIRSSPGADSISEVEAALAAFGFIRYVENDAALASLAIPPNWAGRTEPLGRIYPTPIYSTKYKRLGQIDASNRPHPEGHAWVLKWLLFNLEEIFFTDNPASEHTIEFLIAPSRDRWLKTATAVDAKLARLVEKFSTHNAQLTAACEAHRVTIRQLSKALQDETYIAPYLKSKIVGVRSDWPIRVHGGLARRTSPVGYVDLSVQLKHVRQIQLRSSLRIPKVPSSNSWSADEKWLARLSLFNPTLPEPHVSNSWRVVWFEIHLPPVDVDHLLEQLTLHRQCFSAGGIVVVTTEPLAPSSLKRISDAGFGVLCCPQDGSPRRLDQTP